MIHPGGPADSVASAFELHFARDGEPRERNVMRSLAGSVRFLADPARSVNHGGLDWIELQVEAKLLGRSFERLLILYPLDRPVSIPHTPLLKARAGYARTGAIEPLVREEALAIDVC